VVDGAMEGDLIPLQVIIIKAVSFLALLNHILDLAGGGFGQPSN